MFPKLKGKEKKTLVDVLAFIVTGTQGLAGHAIVPLAHAKAIMKHEPTFIKIQSETPDAVGNVPVFATSLGIAASGAPAQATTGASKPTFELQEGIEVPESKRGGLKGDTYPFASMNVGQSFFVPATESNPNPAKGMASTVSSANKRYASTYPLTTGKNKTAHPKAGQPTGQDGRKFTVRARTVADGEKSNGARVWRTA